MKLHFSLLSMLALTSATVFSQTKKIAFESHSGRAENFSIALNNELFDSKESDFGLPSDKHINKVNKVIYINDSVSVLAVKVYERPWRMKTDSMDKFVGKRKDTIRYNNINSRMTVDSLNKKMGWNNYEFSDKTKFVDKKGKTEIKKEEKPKEQQLLPLFAPNDPPAGNSPFDPALLVMLGSILILSTLGGFISWKLYKPQPATV